MKWSNIIDLGTVPTVLMTAQECSDENKILETIKLISSDYFFDFIEIIEINDKKIREEIKEIIKISHLRTFFTAGHVIFTENLDLNSLDKGIQKKSVNKIKEVMEMAVYFGADKFLVLSGRDVAVSERENAKKILAESLMEICEYAKTISVNRQEPMDVVMEPFDRDYSFKFLIGPTAEAVEVVQKVRKHYANIGLMIDLGHVPLLHEDIQTCLRTASAYLKHMHVGNCVIKDKNSERFGDTHPYFGYAGSEIDLEQVRNLLALLKNINYFDFKEKNTVGNRLPSISLEIVKEKGEDIELIIANTKRVFDRAWQEIFY
jgi:sugar phosphate isomerase/epimerase